MAGSAIGGAFGSHSNLMPINQGKRYTNFNQLGTQSYMAAVPPGLRPWHAPGTGPGSSYTFGALPPGMRDWQANQAFMRNVTQYSKTQKGPPPGLKPFHMPYDTNIGVPQDRVAPRAYQMQFDRNIGTPQASAPRPYTPQHDNNIGVPQNSGPRRYSMPGSNLSVEGNESSALMQLLAQFGFR